MHTKDEDYRQPGARQWDNPNVKPLEAEVSRLGRELRLAQESKDRAASKAAQAAYVEARQRWETAEAEAFVRNKKAYRTKGSGIVKDAELRPVPTKAKDAGKKWKVSITHAYEGPQQPIVVEAATKEEALEKARAQRVGKKGTREYDGNFHATRAVPAKDAELRPVPTKAKDANDPRTQLASRKAELRELKRNIAPGSKGGVGVQTRIAETEKEITRLEKVVAKLPVDRPLSERMAKDSAFKKLEGKLAHEKGVTDPAALAASIGRKKYGAAGMAKKSAAAKDVDAFIYPKNLRIGDKLWKSGKLLTVTMVRPRGDRVIVETREAGPVVLDGGVRVEAETMMAKDAQVPGGSLSYDPYSGTFVALPAGKTSGPTGTTAKEKRFLTEKAARAYLKECAAGTARDTLAPVPVRGRDENAHVGMLGVNADKALQLKKQLERKGFEYRFPQSPVTSESQMVRHLFAKGPFEGDEREWKTLNERKNGFHNVTALDAAKAKDASYASLKTSGDELMRAAGRAEVAGEFDKAAAGYAQAARRFEVEGNASGKRDADTAYVEMRRKGSFSKAKDSVAKFPRTTAKDAPLAQFQGMAV